jgi:hypothetical protein
MTHQDLFHLILTEAAKAGVREMQLKLCGPDQFGHRWFIVYVDLDERRRAWLLNSLCYGHGPLEPGFGGCYPIESAPAIIPNPPHKAKAAPATKFDIDKHVRIATTMNWLKMHHANAIANVETQSDTELRRTAEAVGLEGLTHHPDSVLRPRVLQRMAQICSKWETDTMVHINAGLDGMPRSDIDLKTYGLPDSKVPGAVAEIKFGPASFSGIEFHVGKLRDDILDHFAETVYGISRWTREHMVQALTSGKPLHPQGCGFANPLTRCCICILSTNGPWGDGESERRVEHLGSECAGYGRTHAGAVMRGIGHRDATVCDGRVNRFRPELGWPDGKWVSGRWVPQVERKGGRR